MSAPDLQNYSRLFGLIGYPLGHSFSKKYFGEKFQQEGRTKEFYELFPLANIDELPALIAQYPQLKGLNVTIPYKEQVFPYLTDLDPAAASVGAVNTILIDGQRRIGYNTDIIGFENSLQPLLAARTIKVSGALILGTGGAAKGVAYVLEQLEIPYLRVSRSANKGDITYDQIEAAILKSHPLIVNTTPLGTYPNVDTCPAIPYEFLGSENILYDLVYNPEKTVFLMNGAARGSVIQNGYDMLVLQAEGAWKIWNEQ